MGSGSSSNQIYEKETTIKMVNHEHIIRYEGKNIRVIRINCSPDFSRDLILMPSNPNYVDIMQQIGHNKTFVIKATFYQGFDRSYYIVDSISPPITRYIQSKVKGIILLKDERWKYDINGDIFEIIIENFNDRLICNDKIKQSIVPGKSYKFNYIKDYGDSKYRVLSAKECLNSIEK